MRYINPRLTLTNSARDIAVFGLFKMAAVRHLGFLKVGNCNCQYASKGQYASSHQISCHCAYMAIFSIFSSWRPSTIFDLQKLQILTASMLWSVSVRHHAKFRAIDQTAADIYIWPFLISSRWRPSVILGSLCHCLDHPRRIFGGLCLRKIWLELVQ